jgi:hypothetical protein
MPSVSTRGDQPKRSHSGDDGENPNKRPRNGKTGGDLPNGDDETSIVHITDRVRLSWQSKGKWRAKTPRSHSAPASRGLSRLPLDPSAPSTSGQAMSAPVLEATSAAADPPVLEPPPSRLIETAENTPPEMQLPNEGDAALQAEVARLRAELENKNQVCPTYSNICCRLLQS